MICNTNTIWSGVVTKYLFTELHFSIKNEEVQDSGVCILVAFSFIRPGRRRTTRIA
jgi:hypothetical protein